jgi:hypothetical protein
MPFPEAAGGGDGGAAAGWNPAGGGCDPGENYWSCYAWPVSRTNSGNRAFMCNQSGDVLTTNNQVTLYSGIAGGVVNGLAAYDNTVPNANGDMSDPLAIGPTMNSTDGNLWTIAQ